MAPRRGRASWRLDMVGRAGNKITQQRPKGRGDGSMENGKVRMPALFVGHGSPMNAVEDNVFTRGWRQIAADMPRPQAILAISAHWYTPGSLVADTAQPRTVYDFYGFPKPLYDVCYPVAGDPELARRVQALAGQRVSVDNGWGIDHGTWSVLCHMYPQADIPVCQLSIDRDAGAETHFHIGQAIGALRDEGVLVLASGNVVHNLALVDWSMDGGFPWAQTFDGYIHDCITERRFQDVLQYNQAGESARIAFHSPDHFLPLLYALGAARPDDRLTVYNQACTLGALSMTSYLFS